MRKLIVISLISIFWLLSSYFNNDYKNQEKVQLQVYVTYQETAQEFYKKQCGFCHTPEELIAPDMNKIKAKYLEKYPDQDAFIQAVFNFVKNPDKSNAIYKEGIENFMDMPKMPFKDEQIKKVAEYIYSTEKL